MSLPVTPNTTCDVYRSGQTPPADPDVDNVACYLKPNYYLGLESGEDTNELDLKFTHVLLVNHEVDIRDGYSRSAPDSEDGDRVYVPDMDGTQFLVIYVETKFLGHPSEHKQVYLRRANLTWPTNEL